MSTTKLECEWAYFLYCLDLNNFAELKESPFNHDQNKHKDVI